MFLRQHERVKDGKEHSYWSLVETVRTADGPRQRTLCYLGGLNGSAHARWQKTTEVFNEHAESTPLKLFPAEAEAPDDPNVARMLAKKAHVLVAFLGYALQVTLKHLLKRGGSEYSPAKVLKRLSELYRVDIVLLTLEGREIWLRRITKLDDEQQKILHQLQWQLPERLEPMQIQKCSADSSIA
jgi:hypothetical protein